MPIVYCLVARGVVVECDVSHPLHSGNFKLVALKLLHKVHSASTAADATATHATPTATKRQTLLFDAHTFNFLSLGSLHCLALCTADVKQHTAFLFLADALDTFQRAAGGEGEGEGERAQQQQSQQGGRLEAHKLKAVTDALTARMEQYNSNSADSGRDGAGEERSRQHKQAKERRDRDRGGSSSSSKASKHSAKSSKQQPVFTSEGSAGAEESAAAADELGDHPDAVRNVKRELEVSQSATSTVHKLRTSGCTTLCTLSYDWLLTLCACGVLARVMPALAECEGHAAGQHRPRAESR